MTQILDWTWMPNSATFEPSNFVHPHTFGKQAHEHRSPHWVFDMTLPPVGNKDKRIISALLAKSRGTAVVNVFDPTTPYPAYYERAMKNGSSIDIIPNVTIKATDGATSSLTVSGSVGDVITVDDPIAFTNAGVRHYYRAQETLVLDGTDQALEVYLTPRVDLTGLTIIAERHKPTHRFNVKGTANPTDADGFTVFNLKGVEFWGAIT